MRSKALAGAIGFLIVVLSASAQEKVDENALFADSSSTIDSSKLVNTKAAVDASHEEKGVGFSGVVNSFVTPSVQREWFDDPSAAGVSFPSRIVGNGYIDVRLVGGAKAFADIEMAWLPVPSTDIARSALTTHIDSGLVTNVREFFVDANINKAVYFRIGKQVLQWGRTYFWNPTDFVNVEKKTFLQTMGDREGTYGLKVHIPYKTLFNFYSFVNAVDAHTLNDLPAAARAEALFGRTEAAVSAWGKRNKMPMFGADVSTRLAGLQVSAEGCLRNGKDMLTLDTAVHAGFGVTDLGDNWIPRAALSLMKFLPLNGVADRVTLIGEFYYNNAGYTQNIFNDQRVTSIMSAMENPQLVSPIKLMSMAGDFTTLMSLYEPNNYSRYYAAFFASISQFIIDQATFSCNVLSNIPQQSYVLSTGVSYASLHNFNCGVTVNAFLGNKNTEYTFSKTAMQLMLQMGMTF